MRVHYMLACKLIFFSLTIISLVSVVHARTLQSEQDLSTALTICQSPSIAQTKTLRALAKEVGMTYSSQQCDALYEALSQKTKLNLSRKKISDIGPLSGLTQLQWLGLVSNKISDISPLEGLTQLTRLSLTGNKIADLEPLKRLSRLEILLIGGNSFTDICAVAGLRQLQRLSISGTRVTDIRPVESLSSLTHLYISQTLIADLSPIQNLTRLSLLSADRTPIADITPLKQLVQLTELNLEFTKVTEVNALENLVRLKKLYLSNNQISNISALHGLTAMTRLELHNTPVVNINALQNMVDLTWLELHKTAITDVSALKDLAKLFYLSLSDTNITDVTPLSGLAELSGLHLHNTKITDISPLKSLFKLKNLELGKVTTLRPCSPKNLRDLFSDKSCPENTTPKNNKAYRNAYLRINKHQVASTERQLKRRIGSYQPVNINTVRYSKYDQQHALSKDGWGNFFIYYYIVENGIEKVVLHSLGSDGKIDTHDDLLHKAETTKAPLPEMEWRAAEDVQYIFTGTQNQVILYDREIWHYGPTMLDNDDEHLGEGIKINHEYVWPKTVYAYGPGWVKKIPILNVKTTPDRVTATITPLPSKPFFYSLYAKHVGLTAYKPPHDFLVPFETLATDVKPLVKAAMQSGPFGSYRIYRLPNSEALVVYSETENYENPEFEDLCQSYELFIVDQNKVSQAFRLHTPCGKPGRGLIGFFDYDSDGDFEVVFEARNGLSMLLERGESSWVSTQWGEVFRER